MIGRTAAPAWTGDRGDAQEEVLRLLMLQTRRAPIGAFVMVPFLASLVDPHVDRPGLLVWAVCAFAVIALRAGFAVWWLRTDRRPPASFTRPFMIVTAIASGAMAGLFSLVFLPQAPPMEQGLIVGSMLAWAAGSLATMSHLPMQFYGFIPCLALPLVYSSAASGFAMPYVVALQVVMFSIIVVASVRDYGAMVHETARRRFENQALIEQLSAQTQTALEAQATAEEAVRLKSRFLAATSHDLRQPVTALSVLTGALLLRPLDPVAAAHAQRIDTAVQSLDGLLGALLDPSRLDADEIRAEMTAFSIDALGERVAADLRPVAEAAGIAFTVQCAGGTVVSDPVLLERVLRNLLQNAVRYTPAGSVRLRIARRADDIVIEVRDTGIGIPQEFRERVFEEYFQVSNPGRNRRRGLGLGLSIVRRLCRLLGARIALESEPGRGSVFRVELPIGAAPAAVAPAAARKGDADDAVPDLPEGCTVAVLDDDAAVQDGLTALLEGWGCSVVSAGALAELQAQLDEQALERLDCLITDHRLGDGSDGFDAARAVSDRVAPGAVVVITGDVDAQIEREARSRGHRLLYKPLRPATLRQAVAQAAARAMASRPVCSPGAAVEPGGIAPFGEVPGPVDR